VTATATANGKTGSVTFDWAVTAGDATGTGLIGMYYDTEQFTAIKLVRVDPTVNFDWGVDAPAAGITPDTFSVRWVGQVEATTSGDVTFTLAADDGAPCARASTRMSSAGPMRRAPPARTPCAPLMRLWPT